MPDDSANDFVVTAPDDSGTTATATADAPTDTEPVVVEVYEAIVDPFENENGSNGAVTGTVGRTPWKWWKRCRLSSSRKEQAPDGTSGASNPASGSHRKGSGSGSGSDDTPGAVAVSPDGSGAADPDDKRASDGGSRLRRSGHRNRARRKRSRILCRQLAIPSTGTGDATPSGSSDPPLATETGFASTDTGLSPSESGTGDPAESVRGDTTAGLA